MADSTTPNNPDINTIYSSTSALGSTLTQSVADAFALTKMRNPNTAIGDAVYGINHRQIPTAIPINKDYHGLVFFTRPCLNLSTDNLRKDRIFNQLLSTNPQSWPYIIRCYLDTNLNDSSLSDGLPFSAVDPQQAFIPLLTNMITSLSGFPDISLNVFESHPGAYKEVWGMGDDIVKNYGSYDITANFRNLPGDPITAMFFYWCHYIAAVMEGQLNPYFSMIVNNEIDYQTRIYRLVLDQTRTKVVKIGATGVSFPVNAPIGASFNFDSSKPINEANHDITMTFRSFGAIYNDDILIDEFNKTTILHNATMADATRTGSYTKIPMAALDIFNNQGYPRINEETFELEWWVSNATYALYLPTYTKLVSALKGAQQS